MNKITQQKLLKVNNFKIILILRLITIIFRNKGIMDWGAIKIMDINMKLAHRVIITTKIITTGLKTIISDQPNSIKFKMMWFILKRFK